MRQGVLTRRLRIRDSDGRVPGPTRAASCTWGRRTWPHSKPSSSRRTGPAGSDPVRVDGTVQNTGVDRYRQLDSQHLVSVAARPLDQDSVLLVVDTSQSRIRIAEAARSGVPRRRAPGL